jgi:tetratricopeptide (TPR) repeat protein
LFAAALITATVVAKFVDVTMARQFAEQAVETARGLGDDRLLIKALAELCSTYFFAGEPDLGLPFGQEAVERARPLGDDVVLAASLLLYLQAIGPAASGQLFGEAIACTERSGDHLTNCWLHNDAGWVALAAGDLRAARAHLDAAAYAGQQIGFENTAVPENLGLVLRAEGDPDGARSAFGGALRISRRNGDYWGMAYAILGLACLAGDAGDWNRAAGLHGAAQAFLDRTGKPWQEVEARNRRDGLAQVRAHLGVEQMERAYAQGMTLSLDQALDLALSMAGLA